MAPDARCFADHPASGAGRFSQDVDVGWALPTEKCAIALLFLFCRRGELRGFKEREHHMQNVVSVMKGI